MIRDNQMIGKSSYIRVPYESGKTGLKDILEILTDRYSDKFEFVESDMTAFSKVEVFRYKATLHNGEVEHIFCLGMIGTK